MVVSSTHNSKEDTKMKSKSSEHNSASFGNWQSFWSWCIHNWKLRQQWCCQNEAYICGLHSQVCNTFSDNPSSKGKPKNKDYSIKKQNARLQHMRPSPEASVLVGVIILTEVGSSVEASCVNSRAKYYSIFWKGSIHDVEVKGSDATGRI